MGRDLLDTLLVRHRLRNDAELARKLGCGKGTISKVRAGKIEWPKALFIRIMRVLGTQFIEIDHLIKHQIDRS
jgi:hypothetical protein